MPTFGRERWMAPRPFLHNSGIVGRCLTSNCASFGPALLTGPNDVGTSQYSGGGFSPLVFVKLMQRGKHNIPMMDDGGTETNKADMPWPLRGLPTAPTRPAPFSPPNQCSSRVGNSSQCTDRVFDSLSGGVQVRARETVVQAITITRCGNYTNFLKPSRQGRRS
ncbi:uncharacterized protein LY79DRAFT_196447 [Colletotrichum navitas]|uniref:Uncharacterized protein n=1 Tax=Colletotrichum navitas TaxID=681940 RepID=A0AAD8PZL8_9PEZI|nr:uncharacterized protein LY79DRAFT_196447 [Colletotrichum navitas]KAK1590931.1 hypothetical protein LY79DRAFT_196447 [Colletotrichum navitas]